MYARMHGCGCVAFALPLRCLCVLHVYCMGVVSVPPASTPRLTVTVDVSRG